MDDNTPQQTQNATEIALAKLKEQVGNSRTLLITLISIAALILVAICAFVGLCFYNYAENRPRTGDEIEQQLIKERRQKAKEQAKREEAERPEKTRQQLKQIKSACDVYKMMRGAYPKAMSDLTSGATPTLKPAAANDPWGTPNLYNLEGNKVTLRSAGPDKKMNTRDDITN